MRVMVRHRQRRYVAIDRCTQNINVFATMVRVFRVCLKNSPAPYFFGAHKEGCIGLKTQVQTTLRTVGVCLH